MPEEKHVFGGEWTTEKLNILQKYLQAYVTVMKKQRFTLYYIDAFAGTGYRDEKIDDRIMDWDTYPYSLRWLKMIPDSSLKVLHVLLCRLNHHSITISL